MKRSVKASILAAAALVCLLGLASCGSGGADDFPAGEPVVIKIDSGEVRSITGLEVTRELSRDDGIYADLYVENNGPNPVAASINGQNERTFQAGEKGRIFLEITQTFWGGDREYAVKVVPGANGGSIDIYYEITQRDEIEDSRDYTEDAGR